MHRTTIELDDQLLTQLKKICLKEKKTFKSVVLELVRWGLKARNPSKKKGVMNEWIASKRPLAPAFDPSDRSSYWDQIERPIS